MGVSKHETRIPANVRLVPQRTPVPASCVAVMSAVEREYKKKTAQTVLRPKSQQDQKPRTNFDKRVVTSSSRRNVDSTGHNIKYARVSERAKVSAKWIPIAPVVPPLAAFVVQKSLDRVVVYFQVTIVLLPSWQYLKSHSMSGTSYGLSFSLGV
jgi:hypothetical protein